MERSGCLILVLLAGLIVIPGCNMPDAPMALLTKDEKAAPPIPPMVVEQSSKDVQRRFQAGSQENSDAVRDAVMWAQRYEEMSLSNNQLREKNNELFLENAKLKQEAEKLKTSLEATGKELDEANEFLQQMHAELSKWKSDVLGFREEIKQSQRAQLEALTKILKVLGAESAEVPQSQTEIK